VVVDQHPHADGRGVPAGGDELTEGRLLRTLGIDVEGLRVVLLGEVHDLLFRYLVRPEFVNVSDLDVLVVAHTTSFGSDD
jgi:hypothetical protein